MAYQTNRERTAAALVGLRECYPSLFVASADEWARRVASYWETLRRFDAADIEAACELALQRYPSRFPNAGQLAQLAAQVARDRRAEAKRAQREAELEAGDSAEADRVDYLRQHVIPRGAQAQREWIAEGADDFERAARTFEVESARRRLDPNKPSPADVAKGRMATIIDLLSQHGIG